MIASTPAEQLDRSAAKYARRKQRLDAGRVGLANAVREAVAAGMTEVEASRRAGVTRMTVRSWLGK